MKWSLSRIAASLASVLAGFADRAGSRLEPKQRRLAKSAIWWLPILLVIAVMAVTWYVRRQSQRELEAARIELEKRAYVPFEKKALRANSDRRIRLFQSTRNVRDLARFGHSYFAATDGGLVEFDDQGRLRRHYTVLDGLPESDLTSLATFNSRLFIGTRSQGVGIFDGKIFERYRWPDRNAQAITGLLENRGRLLIGTFTGGLLEFDGNRFKEIKITGGNGGNGGNGGEERLRGINCMVADGARLYVGTFADGLWINEAARWLHFTIDDGLPSNRVVGVFAGKEDLIVATDFGLSTITSEQLLAAGDSARKGVFQTLAILPELSSLTGYRGSALLSRDNGEIFRLVADVRSTGRFRVVPVAWNRPGNLSACRLLQGRLPHTGSRPEEESRPALWLLGDRGIWRMAGPGEKFSGRIEFSSFSGREGGNEESNRDAGTLNSNVISALAFDEEGRLWAGSFRNGIDILAAGERMLTHLESDSIREVNALVWDREAKQMLAATSHGVTMFDPFLRSEQLAKESEKGQGLLSDSVTHIAVVGQKNSAPSVNQMRLALATNRGLSFGDLRQWRGLTTFHGLPSNSVYTVLPHGEFIYAGTLNGVAQIAAGRVTRVFKDSNSKLSQNWVTSLCAAGPRLFAGTYGGGIFELTPAGEFVDFGSEIGRQTVNPNAMTSDGERLYVGTLDGARILDLHSQRWIHLKSELPSSVVLSVVCDEKHVYFGTTGGIVRLEKDYLKVDREIRETR